MKRAATRIVICCLLGLAVAPEFKPVIGGGPIVLRAPGQPIVWPNGGANIPFNPDRGGLGPLTNAEAIALTTAAFNTWQIVPTASATYVNAGLLPFDVDETNFGAVLSAPPNGTHPIIYDEDGAIFDLMFGEFSGILGFAGFDFDPVTGQVTRGVALLNGGDVPHPQLGFVPVTLSALLATHVHECGHYSGLDHSVVNGEIFLTGDTSGPSPNNTFGQPTFAPNVFETMYPLIPLDVVNGELVAIAGKDTHTDDRATLSALYPEPAFITNFGTISGRVIGFNGEAVSGVNVIARNVDNPFEDAVSSISGSPGGFVPVDHPLAGAYSLRGLTPGARYAVYVDEILLGDFSIPKRFGLPGPEEFYSGAGESDNPQTDNPATFTALTAVAGQTLTGIDIIFNRRQPGPLPFEAFLAEGGFRPWLEFALPFRFEMCGSSFDSVFLNAFQGTLTFGGPDNTPFGLQGRISQHLTVLRPRIAGLNTITDISLGGILSFEQTADTFTVRYSNVPSLLPDFSLGGASNTFSISLKAKKGGQRSQAILSYGQLDARDGLAGYSCGNAITSKFETESDLTELNHGTSRSSDKTAIFEEFGSLDNDLDDRLDVYDMPGMYADRYEPNDTRTNARSVSLPFNTATDYAEIAAGDVDFYRFNAKAGELLVAETVPGALLDTVIGLFGADGTLLAQNDDVASVFSRLIFPIPSDAEYTLAVTTFGDDNFIGQGRSIGRYILTLDTYRGTVLPLGDDESVQVALPFKFPYQGVDWTSVWVNSDGNLTFGAPDTDTSDRTVSRFLSGPPRIAPLFADLDPSGFGTGVTGIVMVEDTGKAITVRWVSVPRFGNVFTNSFSVSLEKGGEINMEWRGLRRSGRSVVGVTQGSGVLDPRPTDLSRARKLSAVGTTYEHFLEAVRSPFNVPSLDLYYSTARFKKH